MSDDPANIEAFKWEVRRGLLNDLRQDWPGMGDMANDQRRRAADAIEELMVEVDGFRRSLWQCMRDVVDLGVELRSKP